MTLVRSIDQQGRKTNKSCFSLSLAQGAKILATMLSDLVLAQVNLGSNIVFVQVNCTIHRHQTVIVSNGVIRKDLSCTGSQGRLVFAL